MVRYGLLFSLLASSALASASVPDSASERSVSAPSVSALCKLRGYERRTQGGTLSPRQRERCMRSVSSDRAQR